MSINKDILRLRREIRRLDENKNKMVDRLEKLILKHQHEYEPSCGHYYRLLKCCVCGHVK